MRAVTSTPRRRRRGAGGIEEIGVIMLFLLVVILGTVQLGLFLHDQMRIERLAGSVANFMTITQPATPPTAGQEDALRTLIKRSSGLQPADYALRVRQVQIDAQPPGGRVLWERVYGTMAPPDPIPARNLASAEATDDEVLIVVEMSGRIRGASALFESAEVGQARRVQHTDTQPTYTYARLDPSLTSSKLTMQSDYLTVEDSDDSTASTYADQAVGDGRWYVEMQIEAGEEAQIGWHPAPTPTGFNSRIAREGYGLRTFLSSGIIEVYDPATTSFVQAATGLSPGDRVGVGLDTVTGRVVVRTDTSGTCQTVYDQAHGAPALPARAGASLVNRGTRPFNRIEMSFGKHGFRCKPSGFEGVRTMN